MIDLTKAPFRWNGATFPSIGGLPALITHEDMFVAAPLAGPFYVYLCGGSQAGISIGAPMILQAVVAEPPFVVDYSHAKPSPSGYFSIEMVVTGSPVIYNITPDKAINNPALIATGVPIYAYANAAYRNRLSIPAIGCYDTNPPAGWIFSCAVVGQNYTPPQSCCPPPEPIQINLADYFRPIRHDVPQGGFYGAAEVRGPLWYASEIWSYAGSAADPDDDLVINGNAVFPDDVAGLINGGVDTKLFDLPAGTPLILNVRNSTTFGGPCHSLGSIWIVPTP
jgi:hypothetical protein